MLAEFFLDSCLKSVRFGIQFCFYFGKHVYKTIEYVVCLKYSMNFKVNMNSQQQKARLSFSDWLKTKLKQQQQQTTSEYESKSMRELVVEALKQLNWDLELCNGRFV